MHAKFENFEGQENPAAADDGTSHSSSLDTQEHFIQEEEEKEEDDRLVFVLITEFKAVDSFSGVH